MYALTAKGMRFIDKHTMSLGVPSPVLMENASKAVVDLICSRFPERKTRILVLCGSGNNGGDAVCVARWLTHLGYHTVLYFAGNPDRTSEEFLRQMNIFTKHFLMPLSAALKGMKEMQMLWRPLMTLLLTACSELVWTEGWGSIT